MPHRQGSPHPPAGPPVPRQGTGGPPQEAPQIYLLTPPAFDPSAFAPRLADVLDRARVACVRLALAARDEAELVRAADAVREAAHARDVPVVIDSHVILAGRTGLDGVHLLDGARSVRAARKELGPDAIVGAFCGNSRHDGLSAGEAGADYVAFGPVSGQLGDGRLAGRDLFAWWSEMIEVPVVAEGGLDAAAVADLAPVVDFLALGPGIWDETDPAAALTRLVAAL